MEIKYNCYNGNLINLGNNVGRIPTRTIIPTGFYNIHPKLILKQYTVTSLSEGIAVLDFFTPEFLADAHHLLTNELNKGNLNPHSGLGFCIMYPAGLEVCRWHESLEGFLITQLYKLTNEKWKRQRLNDDFAVTSVDQKVFEYEYRLWLKYTQSQSTELDKREYLSDFLEE